MNRIIPIASDHGGFEMKQFLIERLQDAGYEVKDFGTYSTDSVDYPDMIHPLARAIETGVYPLGIILCGSGNGAQMTANKHPHVRAALCWNEELAKLARQHNDANILAMGARVVGEGHALKIVDTFLDTEFSNGANHIRRIAKMS